MALVDQVAHQRVVGRQVQHVVLHDPGRDDQDRLGENPVGRRRILNELDQAVAVDHLTGGDREGFADGVLVRPDRLLARGRALTVLHEVERALHQVGAALLEGRTQHLRVGQDEVGGREQIEQLAPGELEYLLLLPGHAAQTCRGIVPPLLRQQKALLDQVERRLAPGRVIEAVVLRQRLDAGRRLWIPRRPRRVKGKPQRLARGLVHELRLLAGREAKMHQPVGIGAREHDRRNAAGEPAHRGMQRPVHGLEGLRGRGRRFESLGRDHLPRLLALGFV